MEKGHILKFVVRGRTFDDNVGIKTFPRQTYGVSQESPDHFKQDHTLIGQQGYIYKHENHSSFDYPSQRKSFNIHKCVDQEDYNTLHLKLKNNQVAFHRKKGRLSEFMDKNGWMSPVIPIMGFQRNQQARQLSNKDRQLKIKSLKPKKIYQHNLTKPKVNPNYYNTISVLMSEKLRIRKERNSLQQSDNHNSPMTARNRQLKNKPDDIQLQNVSQKMATSFQFYSTGSTFYSKEQNLGPRAISGKQGNNRYKLNSNISFRTNSCKRGTSPAYKCRKEEDLIKIEKKIDNIDRQDQQLDEWYHKINYSKWAYKPQPLETQENQQDILISVKC